MIGRAVAGVSGLLALAALWQPWFQPPAGEPVIMFGALDRQSPILSPTAWQAFSWEDVVLATIAVATFAVAAAGRRWFLVPAAGAIFTAGVLVVHRSMEPYPTYAVPATAAGFVALLTFAAAAVGLAAGRYRLRRR